jgi:pimeloyl-ACP methyl ester carboxylesterase
MLRLLDQQYAVVAIEKLGHDPDYPIDDNWQGLVRELTDHIERSAERPVIGVGHSLGGILTFMAAYRRPQLFSQVIMLDPPLVYGPFALAIFLAKKLGLIDHIRLVSQTRKRRSRWSSKEEAEAHFRAIPLFRRFDPDCLRDYIDCGTVGVDGGVALSFDSGREAGIFRTTPHNLTCLRRRLPVPGAVVVGEDSYTADTMLRCFARRHGMSLDHFKEGSHLFPLEHPERTALFIMDTIDKLRPT